MIIGAVGSLYYFMVSSNASRTSTQLSSAEERGRLAMFFLGEPIALAGYGNVIGVNETAFENVAMPEPTFGSAPTGGSQDPDPLNGNFTCVRADRGAGRPALCQLTRRTPYPGMLRRA